MRSGHRHPSFKQGHVYRLPRHPLSRNRNLTRMSDGLTCRKGRCMFDRRRFLVLSGATAGAAMASSLVPELLSQPALAEDCSPPIPTTAFNGSNCPYPIPWLDKNGSHNQSPAPGVELSNIFHFKGKIARCNNWAGMGTDNKGNRIPWGSPTTDFSYMQGAYFAGRQEHTAAFAHI
jgi:hypothetical protein